MNKTDGVVPALRMWNLVEETHDRTMFTHTMLTCYTYLYFNSDVIRAKKEK